MTVLVCSETLSSQSFKLLRYDENYEYLKDSTKSFYDNIKYLPLNKKKDIYLSLGGEARYEYVDFSNEDWGRLNIGHNDFFFSAMTFMQTGISGKTSEYFHRSEALCKTEEKRFKRH
ncbi:hypothetical protein OWR28_09465 [Chryseobacterium sp. 1B4]